MEVISYNFVLPRHPKMDDHSHLFRVLKSNGIHKQSTDDFRIQFVTKQGYIFCRSPLELPNIPSKVQAHQFEPNQTIQLAVVMSNKQRHYRFENGLTKEFSRTLVSPIEISEYFTKFFKKHGLEISALESKNAPSQFVNPLKKPSFTISCLDLVFTAKIVDLNLFLKAWTVGVGRQKTYGLGMLRVIS